MISIPKGKGPGAAIVTIAGTGIAVLGAHPELPPDIRAVGIIVVPAVASLCIALQNIFSERLNRLGAKQVEEAYSEEEEVPRRVHGAQR